MIRSLILAATAIGLIPSLTFGQNDPIVTRAVDYLRTSNASLTGETALAALALIKSGVLPTDPTLSRMIAVLEQRFDGSGYRPQQEGGPGIYEAGVTILALANHGSEGAHKGAIEAAAQYLMSKQNANGAWDYTVGSGGDSSISQYAVLGLWEAENAGVAVSPDVWERAAGFYLSTQKSSGGFVYHPFDGGGPETVSMTAAGVGSLLICSRQLAPYRTQVEKSANPLLTPLSAEPERRKFNSEISPKRFASAISAGIAWLSANFTVASSSVIGPSPYYALYGIERVGALADQATLGRVNWFNEGRRYLASTQGGDGSFSSQYGNVPNTAWGVLFLTKSTAKTIKRIQVKRLGAGTLIGGRGLPKDLSQITVAGGKVIARPMDGAVEQMINALEDPRVEDASTALAGLVDRYQAEGPRALEPHVDRFRKLLEDRDPGIRRVSAWALARTGDLSVAPLLIKSLKDPDQGVVDESTSGLRLLSRRIDGPGVDASAPADRKDEAIRAWQTWHDSVQSRPAEREFDPAAPPAPGPRSRGGRR